jgi:phosphate transport system substrate-binding protein
LLWALVALAVALVAASVTLVLLREARGPRPPFLAEAPSEARPVRSAAEATPAVLELAGSGSNLPLTRALAEAFRARSPGARLTVHESIGTTGGVRAVRDGAIQVGLASRPLTADESRLGLAVTAYARVAVVVATNAGVHERCTTKDDLLAIYGGTRTRWSDGSRLVVLQRERGDSSLLAVGSLVPGFVAVNDAAYREQRWRVLYSDLAMQEALLATEGAVGIFDLGAIEAQRLPINVLCIDGVVPSRETLLSGAYPFGKDLAFVTAGAPSRLGAEFIAFVLSSEGRELTARLGYLPLPLSPSSSPSSSPSPGVASP